MREIIRIVKANIKGSKSSFISIVILMFLISFSTITVLSVDKNASKRHEIALKDVGFGDLICSIVVDEKSMTTNQFLDLIKKVEGSSVVGEVNYYESAFIRIKDIRGKKSNNDMILLGYNKNNLDFAIFDESEDNILTEEIVLNRGEICVPISFKSMYNCEIGDIITINSDASSISFKVKYFFEDPYMGASMMGLKNLLINEEELKNIREDAIKNSDKSIAPSYSVNIFRADFYKLSGMRFQQTLNNETGIAGYSVIAMLASQSETYTLILVNVFTGILLFFIVLLLIVTLIILSHSISSSIEMEYVNIGILKALGFTKSALKIALLFQYLLASFIGILMGIPVAIPIIKLINTMIRPVVNLYISSNIAVVPVTVVLGIVVLFIAVFILLKIRTLSKITPIRAISAGKADVYFKNIIETPIRKKNLNLWLALRQLTSNFKQYISATLVAMFLVGFLIMVTYMLYFWLAADGKNINKLYDPYDADVSIYYIDKNLQNEVETIINEEASIEHSFKKYSEYVLLNGYQIYCIIFDDAKYINQILEGRVCQYDNEIIITEFVADELNLKIGDSVEIAFGDYKSEYIISGYYQSSNDMGINFAMTKAGFDKLVEKDDYNMRVIYKVINSSKTDNIIDILNNKYTNKQIEVINEGGVNIAFGPVLNAIKGIGALIYVIVVIFSMTTIFMVCQKVFIKETRDYGTYKSLGITSSVLRVQFAIRFAIVAIVGGLFGVILSMLSANALLGTMFNYIGVSRFESEIDIKSIAIPFIFIVALFFVSAYILSYKIKKVDTKILITE